MQGEIHRLKCSKRNLSAGKQLNVFRVYKKEMGSGMVCRGGSVKLAKTGTPRNMSGGDLAKTVQQRLVLQKSD